ncbi:MAG: hypothetical protein RIE74_02115 [Pseudomonadales bacterium]
MNDESNKVVPLKPVKAPTASEIRERAQRLREAGILIGGKPNRAPPETEQDHGD